MCLEYVNRFQILKNDGLDKDKIVMLGVFEAVVLIHF
jgi:hypothetical protein